MSAAKHLQLLVYSFVTWLTFFLVGLPEYYQHWPLWGKFAAVVLVTVIYFPLTRFTLQRYWSDGKHFRNSLWLAAYLTVPLFIYDYLLLGLFWKQLGLGFVFPYWYLSFFYFSFWVQFPWIGYRMQQQKAQQ